MVYFPETLSTLAVGEIEMVWVAHDVLPQPRKYNTHCEWKQIKQFRKHCNTENQTPNKYSQASLSAKILLQIPHFYFSKFNFLLIIPQKTKGFYANQS